MMHFTVEDYSAVDASCQKCCCEKLNLKPGTTSKVSIGYAPWALPIGQLHCSPQFSIEPLATCAVPIAGSNFPPQVPAEIKFNTGTNVRLDSTLGGIISDPEGDRLTFKVLPLYGPKYGKMQLDPNGPFSYTPMSLFQGEERFYCSVTDDKHDPVIFEVMIAVGIDSGTMAPTPHISVGAAVVDQRYFTVYFPVTLSPAAQPCELWRLSVQQMALDCNCICFSRIDCFDLGVAAC